MTAQEAKQYAALYYALACTRGQLYDVRNGRGGLKSTEAVLEATATDNIARALGVSEADVASDWNEHLSEAEKDLIGGRTGRA